MLENCFRFAPRDSIPGLIAKICKYLKDHPGWSEDELEDQIKVLVSATGVESFNGRTGSVTLHENDINKLKIAQAYFAGANETINSLNLASLYDQGVRFVFTDFNAATSGYNLVFVLDYLENTGEVKYYPMSTGSGGGGNIVSVNGKTGVVDIKVVDVSNGNSTDKNAYIFVDELEDYPDVPSSDSAKLGGEPPSYYATTENITQLNGEKANNAIVSDTWQSWKTYSAGEYCIYNNSLYKSLVQTTAVPTNGNDWAVCTVADEIAAINTKNAGHKQLTSAYGVIDFYEDNGVVSFYGYLTGMPTGNKVSFGPVPSSFPVSEYSITSFYDSGSPYSPIGSVWVYREGSFDVFKPNDVTVGYVYGTYICNR